MPDGATALPAPVMSGAGDEIASLTAGGIGGVLLIVADVVDRLGLGLLGIAFLGAAWWMLWFTAVRRHGSVIGGVVATLALGLFGWMSGSVAALAVPWVGTLAGLAPLHRKLRLMTLLVLSALSVVVIARS